MSAAIEEKKGARYWWLALLGLCRVPCIAPIACRLDPKAVLSPIPVGSKLSELDKYLTKFNGGSMVQEWVSVGAKDSPEHRTTKYGSFYVRDLGEYGTWSATKEERDAFKGELLFFHRSTVIPDDLAPSYVFSLIYVSGVLKDKDYGHITGYGAGSSLIRSRLLRHRDRDE